MRPEFDQLGGNGHFRNPGELHPPAPLRNLSSRLDGSVAYGSALKVDTTLIRWESDVNNNSRKRVVRTTYWPDGEAVAAPAKAVGIFASEHRLWSLKSASGGHHQKQLDD
jgi:hypothetical protein